MSNHYGKKALRTFLTLISLSLILFIILAGSVHYGLLNLLGLTWLAKNALLCCKTFFSFCLISPTMFKTLLPWTGLGIITGGLLIAAYKAGRSLILSNKFLKALHIFSIDDTPVLRDIVSDSHVEVIPFDDTLLKSAFTIGLLYPKIYISTGLINELTREELRSVLLHEIHHAVKKDPLRLFILSFIKDTLFFLPFTRYLTDSFYKIKELAADERAAVTTGRPIDMASALLKMTKLVNMELIPAGVHILDRRELLEERVKNLLEPEARKEKRIPKGLAVFTFMGIIIFFIVFTIPTYSKVQHFKKCNHNYCLSGERVCPSNVDNCHSVCEDMKK